MMKGSVVSTAAAASPNAPLALNTAAGLIFDQSGRLIVNDVAAVRSRAIAPLDASGDVLMLIGAGSLTRVILSLFVATGWLYICDKAAAPGSLSTLITAPIPFAAAALATPSYIDISFADVGGLTFTAGIVLAISSTGPTFTAAAASTGRAVVFYMS